MEGTTPLTMNQGTGMTIFFAEHVWLHYWTEYFEHVLTNWQLFLSTDRNHAQIWNLPTRSYVYCPSVLRFQVVDLIKYVFCVKLKRS